MLWLEMAVNRIMVADRLFQRPVFPFIHPEVAMNPFTESTVARPLSEFPSNAANDDALQELEAGPRGKGLESRPSSHGVREGRMPLRHPRAARLARRRARVQAQAQASGDRPTAFWQVHCRKAAGALLGFVLALALPSAWAVDVNSANAQQLETITGIGPKTAQVIIDERTRGGSFESFDDLAERVKGIGPKKAQSLQAAGLVVGQADATPKNAAPATQRKAGK